MCRIELVQERLHHCTEWKEVGAIFQGFLSSADATFEPSVDTYSGWVSVLGRSPAELRRTFVAAWATKVIAAIETLSDMRDQCREMGLSEMGNDVGRASLMLLRLVFAIKLTVETVATKIELTKRLMTMVFGTKIRTWSKLLLKNTEFTALLREIYRHYFQMISHEGWRLRRRAAKRVMFVLEQRHATLSNEWEFASSIKNELGGIIGDAEEIFTLGFLDLCQVSNTCRFLSSIKAKFDCIICGPL